MYIRRKGATAQWRNGAMVQRYDGITAQWYNGATAQRQDIKTLRQ